MTKPVEIHQENTLRTPKYTMGTQIYNGNSGAGHVKLANRKRLANFTFPYYRIFDSQGESCSARQTGYRQR